MLTNGSILMHFLINITHIFLGVIRNSKSKREGQTMILQNTTQKTKD
jgi:hypothetical protein